jgi:hypothetical protein
VKRRLEQFKQDCSRSEWPFSILPSFRLGYRALRQSAQYENSTAKRMLCALGKASLESKNPLSYPKAEV